ncbi:MAG: ABC transporter ATP-binding protein [Gammaproteobacteria bacterium]|nr:ABC transporter ATP-binding protein [Gammaproteobacteria bacterium]
MKKALSIRELTKVYDNGFVALKGIDLDVEQGEFFALLGPNGAGKSTAIGIICSLVNKTSGKVTVFDHDIDTDFGSAKACLGVVPQEFNFNMFETARSIVLNQAGYYGIARPVAMHRAQKYLTQLGLWNKRDTVARNLSGGMKRRLLIARALIHEPRLLILDEPTAGVDIEIRRSMWQFLKDINNEGTTIILTTHYLEEAESLCRQIAIIDGGELIENTTMKHLLGQLSTETFVLDLTRPVDTLPAVIGHNVHLIDDTTLEVEIDKQHGFNRLFSDLSANGIDVQSMRNKSNRLEQLFMGLVDGNGSRDGTAQQ